MSHVIAICGMMGSGKSTAVAHLLKSTPDCVAFHEDEYNPALKQSIEEVQAWWERGAPVGEIDLSTLAAELQEASENFDGVVLLETQFGRLHPNLRPLIDLQCWIDVEPDIALARKIAQLATQFAESPESASSVAPLHWLAEFCKSYFQTTRKLFVRQRNDVSGQSDIVIGGDRSPADVCEQVRIAVPGLFRKAA
jgi:hypothetical protein